MVKRIVSVLMCLLLAAGMAATAEEAAQADTTTGTPWMDPEILGNVTEDTPTDPKDNFALYANKDKILTTEIYTLSLHDALPISPGPPGPSRAFRWWYRPGRLPPPWQPYRPRAAGT